MKRSVRQIVQLGDNITKGRSERTELEERGGEACISDSELGEKNFFIAKSSI